MRRFLCLFAACLLLAACGEKTLQVQTPPPSPQPAPRMPTPASAPQPSQPVATAEAERVAAAEPLGEPVAEEPLAEDQDPVIEPLSDEESLIRRLEAIEMEALQRSYSAAEMQSPDLPALAAEDGSLLDEIELDAIPEDYDLERDRETILRNTRSELPLTLNDQVARMINYFSSRGAKTFRITMGRAAAYREMIERILEEEGVPAEMIHLAQAESGFRPKARSYARATGMWQFMAFRGKQYGLRQDRYLEERYDLEASTRAAARHLKDLEIEFGDWYLAMAAYNSGPGRVRRAIERGGTRDYWELCKKRLLPRQTRDYVPIILAMTYIAKHPKLYDVGEIDPAPTLRYDTVEVAEEISAELIADIVGTNATEIEQLNQALLRSATPPYRYELRLPPGTAERFHTELAAIPADKRMAWRRHEVGEGDSLAGIAGKYGVSADQLLAVNGLDPNAVTLEPGARLTIPAETKLRLFRTYGGGAGGLVEDGSGRYKIARGDTLGGIARRFGVSVGDLRSWNGLSSSAIRAGRYLIVRPEGVGAPARSSSAPDGTYRVARGDTLGKIAARYRTSVRQLQAWNGLRSSRIHVGDVLKVPGSSSSSAEPSTPTPGGTYRIRRGDSLGSIARRHGVTIADLQQWNGLRGNAIRAGDSLHVRAPSASAGQSGSSTTTASSGGGEIRYKIRSGDSLATIASRHNVSISDLRAWNGIRGSSIRAGETLVIRNQASAAPAPKPVRAAAPVAPAPSAPPAVAPSDGRYKIRPGDNLGAIAETFGVRASDLRRWNNMRGSRIVAGDYLIVRPPSARSASAQPSESAPVVAKAEAPAPRSPANPGLHVVRSGDTLGAIASRYGVTVRELRAWNGIRGSRLDIGQRIITAAPRTSSNRSSGNSGGGSGTYRIRNGDTLAVIADRFNVSVKDLMSWNGLKSTRIRAGSYLRVRSDAGGDD